MRVACLRVQYQNYKLIYRRYAGLYFAMGVDVTDNELSYLECIHLFVELLDEYFRNVCELDIVFNFNKVRLRDMHAWPDWDTASWLRRRADKLFSTFVGSVRRSQLAVTLPW
jgi:hypothetical protein